MVIATSQFTISVINDGRDGQDGAKGDRGISITKTREQWFLSTSNSSLSGNPGTETVDGKVIPVGTWTYTEPSVIPDNYYLWGRLETTMSDTSVQYSDAVYRSTIAGIINEIDKANLTISQKVSQTDIDNSISAYDGSTTTTMYNRWSSLNQNLNGITTRVGNVETTTGSLGTRMTNAESLITQNANKIGLMVSVDGTTSSLTLTDKMLTAMTNQFIIKDPDGTATVISGGKIQTGSITTNMLATNAIKSTNYAASSNINSPFTFTGSFFDLSNGNFYTPNFGVINTSWENGPAIGAYFNGRVEANSGKFGNSSSYWNIETVYDYYSQPHAALVGTGSPYLQTGNWQVSDNAVSTRKYTSSSASTGNVGYYSNGGYYYDFGMKVITPDGDSDSVEYKKSLFYVRKVDTQHGIPSLDSGWTYPFRVDSDGHLYCTDLTIIGGGTPTTFLPIGGGTITGNLTVEGTLTATASKASELATTHTIITNLASTDGAAYTGKSNITPGVTGTLGVGHGGTGKSSWTQWGIVYASATNTLAQIGAGTSGQVLRSNGSAAPSWTNQSALSVGSATKATQDADGNVISSTYRKLDNGIFDTIQVTDLNAGDLMVTGVGRFTNGLYGDLTGSATSATKDGSGNVISSTYVKKSGDTMTGTLTIESSSSISDNLPATLRFRTVQTDNNLTTNAYIYVYDDHDTNSNGTNMVIQSSGNVFVGGGESPMALYNAIGQNSTSECMYVTADTNIYFESKAQTITNRVGMVLNNSHELLPIVAETSTNNIGSIGNASYKWSNVYATTIHGDLDGNATTATSAGKWTNGITLTVGNTGKTLDGSGNVSYTKAEISGLAQPVSGETTVTANAGWMSGADKFKLDSITVTSGGTIATKNITVERGIQNASTVEGVYQLGHSNSITAGTAQGTATSTLTNGGSFTVPKITYDSYGHITSTGTNTLTLPTYNAVTTSANGLMISTDKTKLNNINIAYGTCTTAAGTAAKVVNITSTGDWSLVVGSIIAVRFSNSNTASNVTLNVNNTGAKSIWYNNALYTSTSQTVCGYANRTHYYMYDGTNWVWMSHGAEDNSNTVPTAHCTTAAGTAAKTATCSNYKLPGVDGSNVPYKSHTILLIANSNTASGALTLNINGTGVRPLYINGTASSASNCTLPAGSYFLYYDGTNYYVRTDGKITGDISGNAATATSATSATSATNDGAGNVISTTYAKLSGATFTGEVTGTIIGGTILKASNYISANSGKSNTDGGLVLWGANTTQYSLAARATSNSGVHGYVSGDFAIYSYMSATTDEILSGRGWVLRDSLNSSNVASVSAKGHAVFNGSVTVGGNAANTSGCRQEYNSELDCLDFIFN